MIFKIIKYSILYVNTENNAKLQIFTLFHFLIHKKSVKSLKIQRFILFCQFYFLSVHLTLTGFSILTWRDAKLRLEQVYEIARRVKIQLLHNCLDGTIRRGQHRRRNE